jgi:uncharacterized membrane-anchored protein
MKKLIFIASTLFIFIVFNYAIFQKEQLKSDGEIVLLELAPVDPRSLMQGDYMRLSYNIERIHNTQPPRNKGFIVLGLDNNNVGTFKGFYEGGDLAKDEKLFSYDGTSYTLGIKPDSFMFQEGHGKMYERARYGVFKIDGKGSQILIGLADDKMNLINPNN